MMRVFAKNPEVAAYKAFARDNDFRKIKLLACDIRMLEIRQGFAQLRYNGPKSLQIEEKMAAKCNEVRALKQNLAQRHDLKAVLAGIETYKNSFAFDLKVLGWVVRETAITVSILLGTTILVGSAILPFAPGLTENARLQISTGVGFASGLFLAAAYVAWRMFVRPHSGDVVEMAASQNRTKPKMPTIE